MERLVGERRASQAGVAVDETGRADCPDGRVPAPWARIWRAAGRYWAETACAALLILMGVNLLSVLPGKTITNDEIIQIPAGYTALVGRDFRPNNEHPPLAKVWAALPLIGVGTSAPPAPSGTQAATPDERTNENVRGFWGANSARFAPISFWARVPMIALTLALGALIFGYARRLCGPRAAVLATALFAVEPTILAHGRVVQTDIPAALTYLGTFVALHAFLAAPTPRRAALLGLASGAAFVTKFSMLALAPIVAVAAIGLWLLAPRRGLARRRVALAIGIAALVALLTINVAYGFDRRALEAADLNLIAYTAPVRGDEIVLLIDRLSALFPTYFLVGVYTIFFHNDGGHSAGLLGQYSAQGWWYYFPVAFGLKTTIPFLIVAVGALGWAAWRLVARRELIWLAILVPFAIYAAATMRSNLNIGIRHLLPAFPFLCILGGAALDRLLRLWRPRALGVAVVALALGWMGLEAARAYPDYIPYMNQLARQPRWHYLSDSNVEWGDDVGALADYLRARDETEVRGALLGGWGTLPLYGIAFHDLAALPAAPAPPTRYVAIGASFLNGSTVPGATSGGDAAFQQGRRDLFAPYRDRAPEAIFGGTIYLYRDEPQTPDTGFAR
jgi:4-amino-4-deoxy-L-arabinose transferase-like glycosyltransferase